MVDMSADSIHWTGVWREVRTQDGVNREGVFLKCGSKQKQRQREGVKSREVSA